MFRNCNAYTIASESEWHGRLSGIMQQVGFRRCTRLEAAGRMDAAMSKALSFLIIHSSKSRDLISRVASAVRKSDEDHIRFMPIVVLLDASRESEVVEFINLGCDDIIIYPCTPQVLSKRLELQVTTKREYFETDTYFGPDRRIPQFDKAHPDRKGGAGSFYKKIVIKRDLSGKVTRVSETEHQLEMA